MLTSLPHSSAGTTLCGREYRHDGERGHESHQEQGLHTWNTALTVWWVKHIWARTNVIYSIGTSVAVTGRQTIPKGCARSSVTHIGRRASCRTRRIRVLESELSGRPLIQCFAHMLIGLQIIIDNAHSSTSCGRVSSGGLQSWSQLWGAVWDRGRIELTCHVIIFIVYTNILSYILLLWLYSTGIFCIRFDSDT